MEKYRDVSTLTTSAIYIMYSHLFVLLDNMIGLQQLITTVLM